MTDSQIVLDQRPTRRRPLAAAYPLLVRVLLRGLRIRGAALLSLGVLTLVGAAGCSFLEPQRDPTRFYTLAPPASVAAEIPSSSTPTLLYGLGPITLPAYLDRNEIALRRSGTEIFYSSVDRWAEPLSKATSRALYEDLSGALRTDRILLYPWPGGSRVDYQIEVEILRFEPTSEQAADLAARWTIRDGGGNYVALHESTYSHPVAGGTVGAVDAMGDALNDLATDIAAALRALPSPRR